MTSLRERSVAPWCIWLYAVNSALLFTHEADSTYWREWELFHMPGGIAGFLLLNLALFLAVQVGFYVVARRAPGCRACGALMASAGIVAGALHGAFLVAGTPQFRSLVSLGLLGVWLMTSLVHLVLVLTRWPEPGDVTVGYR